MSPADEYSIYADLAWADLNDRITAMRREGWSVEDSLWNFLPPTVPDGYKGPVADVEKWLERLLQPQELKQVGPDLLVPPEPAQSPSEAPTPTPEPVSTQPSSWWF